MASEPRETSEYKPPSESVVGHSENSSLVLILKPGTIEKLFGANKFLANTLANALANIVTVGITNSEGVGVTSRAGYAPQVLNDIMTGALAEAAEKIKAQTNDPSLEWNPDHGVKNT